MSFWKLLFATTALLWAILAWMLAPGPAPVIEPSPYNPTLAERNAAWSRLCTYVDCNALPLGFFTVDLNKADYRGHLIQGPRLYIPLNDAGFPVASIWTMPLTAANVDEEGRGLRQYYSGRIIEIQCCDRAMLDALGIVGEPYNFGLGKHLSLVVTPSSQHTLGWHLYGHMRAAADRDIDTVPPPAEFLEDFDAHFWRVSHKYKLNGARVTVVNEFLSKRPLVSGRYVYATCRSSGCTLYTIARPRDQNTSPHVEFGYSQNFKLGNPKCTSAPEIEGCDPIIETLEDLAQKIKLFDTVLNALLTPP